MPENLVEFNLVGKRGTGSPQRHGRHLHAGTAAGTVIRNNVFRDISSHGYGDGGCTPTKAAPGSSSRTMWSIAARARGFTSTTEGENLVRNNLIAFNREQHELMRTRSERSTVRFASSTTS